MNFIDDWHDGFRLVNMVVSAASLYLLARRFSKNSSKWNSKTRDYWYALVMWCITGVAVSIEGILRDSPPGARPIFVLIASLVTLRGLTRSGSWGHHED